MSSETQFDNIRGIISKESQIIGEISSLVNDLNNGHEEENMIMGHMNSLKDSLRKENESLSSEIKNISIVKPLPQTLYPSSPINSRQKNDIKKMVPMKANNSKQYEFGEKISSKIKKNVKKNDSDGFDFMHGKHLLVSTKMFSGISEYFMKRGWFDKLKVELVKANMKFLPKVYVSIMFYSTMLAFIVSVFITVFLMFFNISASLPFITPTTENIVLRFIKFSWIALVFPAGTFLIIYFYPTFEKGSIEGKINRELPFATINMAAISGSLINPTRIFNIIIQTHEYPAMEKEFIKIINGINILGQDLVTVLRNTSSRCPSKKLAELFSGLATTISSGGDLPKFFEERSKNLLFEYQLEKEKDTRTAETFMDIYISVVIAAPMILMLLLIMIQISGLGISLSIQTITLIMISGVAIINVLFLTFLHLRQPAD